MATASETRSVTDRTIHRQVNKYDIANYIYFNYSNWRSGGGADYGFGVTQATLSSRTEQVIQEQDNNFKALTGMTCDEFMEQISGDANILQAFNQIFTGGEAILGEGFTSDNFSAAKKANAAAANDIINANSVSLNFLGVEPSLVKSLTRFLKASGDLATNLYTVIGMTQNAQTVDAINQLFSSSVSLKANADATLFYQAMKGTLRELKSNTGLAQVGSENYDSALARYFSTTLNSSIQKVSENVTSAITKLTAILDKMDARQPITNEEVTAAYRGLQSTLGINSELIGTMETRVVGEYFAQSGQTKSDELAKALGNAVASGTSVSHGTDTSTNRILLDGVVLTGSGNVDIRSILGINKTADTTATYTDGTTISFSQKRYNPYTAYSIHLTSRSLIRLLAYLEDGDPGLANFCNTEMFFNGMYYAFGGISYSQKTYSKKAKRNPGGAYNRKVAITRNQVDADHNEIITNFALRLYLDYFSTMNQAFFNINGEIIPAPIYARIASQNIISSFGGAGQGNFSISKSLSFGGAAYTVSGDGLKSSNLGDRLRAIVTKRDITQKKNSVETRGQAAERNSDSKRAILSTQVSLKMPYITVDQYREALSTGGLSK